MYQKNGAVYYPADITESDALFAFQGFLGWYMVASGLVDRPHVSHFRLTIHLLTASRCSAWPCGRGWIGSTAHRLRAGAVHRGRGSACWRSSCSRSPTAGWLPG